MCLSGRFGRMVLKLSDSIIFVLVCVIPVNPVSVSVGYVHLAGCALVISLPDKCIYLESAACYSSHTIYS